MVKRNAKTQVSMTIGLDIGYGAVKTVRQGGESIIFPAVAGFAPDVTYGANKLTLDYPGDQVTGEDSRKYFVGDLASKQIPTAELIRLRGRTGKDDEQGNQFRLLMALAAIGKVADVSADEVLHLHIGTGLPVDHMREATVLKETLKGAHRVKTDTRDFVVNVVGVNVMPQPYGTIYAAMLTQAGEIDTERTAMRVGVVDVGTYTVDLALDDDGDFLGKYSGSVEGGVHTIQQRIERLIEAEHHQTPSLRDVETCLRTKKLKIRGEEMDYTDEVSAAIEPLERATLNLMGTKWKAGIDVDEIYVSGGGAALVWQAVKKEYPQARLMENAQTANATGYLRYAMMMASNG